MEANNFNFGITDKGKAPTRKGIFPVVSFMYDPLGFVAPIILPAKSLMLSSCRQK